jgi:hypothetical protein
VLDEPLITSDELLAVLCQVPVEFVQRLAFLGLVLTNVGVYAKTTLTLLFIDPDVGEFNVTDIDLVTLIVIVQLEAAKTSVVVFHNLMFHLKVPVDVNL